VNGVLSFGSEIRNFRAFDRGIFIKNMALFWMNECYTWTPVMELGILRVMVI
jgi:hypothetical protein